MVYVVTAVHNRINITTRFIEGLKKQTYKGNIHFIMVDDGSTDGSDTMVKNTYPESTIIYGNGKLYWGGALDKAYKFLLKQKLQDDDVIFFVNDDSTLESDYIDKAVKLLEMNPNDLVTGCGYGIKSGNYLDGPVKFNLKNGAVTHLPAGSTGNCASTRALCMRAKVFQNIGGFHPFLLPHYASDYEYTLRANRKGHRIISSKDLKYTFSEDTTGDNSHKNISLKKIMSKRSKLNPFYKLNFILMIAPIYRLPTYIIYQFKHLKFHERDSGRAL
ncbi:MAG: glycosyltransferase family 2 protein [Turicibacter sanguinis]|uniref:glycosyltransferase family 2 protein n=1 Tax=Turicibacter sanguinis TaxID=154288 RepID=UPI0039960A4A